MQLNIKGQRKNKDNIYACNNKNMRLYSKKKLKEKVKIQIKGEF